MSSQTRVGPVRLAVLLLVLSAGTAHSGQAYSDAMRYLQQGDAKGLPLMEQVCKAEPFASNAFYFLAMGYLKIEKKPEKAMDAALRGLEGYDERWNWKVPKKALYGILQGAAKGASPGGLGTELTGRVRKLVARDGKLAEDCLAKLKELASNGGAE